MFLAPLVALVVAGTTLASPLHTRQAPPSNITASTVYLSSGTTRVPVVGYTNKEYNVSSYLGIPFATSERFRAPVLVDYAGNQTAVDASTMGKACMQSPGRGRELGNGTYTSDGVGEDCLGVNVYTPAGVGNATGLPVVVWCE